VELDWKSCEENLLDTVSLITSSKVNEDKRLQNKSSAFVNRNHGLQNNICTREHCEKNGMTAFRKPVINSCRNNATEINL
jgi:hypothetical protein